VKRFIVPIVLIAAIGGLLVYALYLMQAGEYSPRDIPSPLVGKPLPSFSLPSLHEPRKTITRDSLHGRVYLLNVWASWCVACRQEHPVLMAIAHRKAVPIIGLNYKDKREDALRWLTQFDDPYEASIVDADGRVGIDLGVYGVPETFVIDKAGVIRHKHIGPISERDWTEKLLPLIQQLS
jgi:cytochrome c biogenesis protein CcmG/thiol:disulfide interchange protein DsbE